MGQPTPLWRSWGSSSPRKRRSLAGRTERSDPCRNPWRSRRRAPAPTSNSDLRTKTKPQFSINHTSLIQTPFLLHEQKRAPDLHSYRSRDWKFVFSTFHLHTSFWTRRSFIRKDAECFPSSSFTLIAFRVSLKYLHQIWGYLQEV